MSDLTWNRYGKSLIRLVKVRRADPHELVDLTIDVQLEGEFQAVYVDGDNGSCLATDTMKNTVYALARRVAHRLAAPCGRRPASSIAPRVSGPARQEVVVALELAYRRARR